MTAFMKSNLRSFPRKIMIKKVQTKKRHERRKNSVVGARSGENINEQPLIRVSSFINSLILFFFIATREFYRNHLN